MIDGLHSLDFKIDKLEDTRLIETAMKQATQLVQGSAKALAPVRKSSGGGALRQSIYTDMEKRRDVITGIVYTNLEYAPYVEFGTGPRGAADHKGISPHVNVAYRTTSWMIPAKDISPEDAEAYGFPKVYGDDGQIIGYATAGQAAQPFMYPALKDNEKQIERKLKSTLKQYIEGLTDD